MGVFFALWLGVAFMVFKTIDIGELFGEDGKKPESAPW